MLQGIGGLRGVAAAVPTSAMFAALRMPFTWGTFPARLIVAGTLLAAGLPLLSILLYVWGYPVNAVPRTLVIIVDGAQILIILNAIVVAAQLVAGARTRASHRADGRRTRVPARGSDRMGLRELSLDLAEMIWEHERRSAAASGDAVLSYVREAVTAELEHRRRMEALERRSANLDLLLREGRVAEARRRILR